MGTVPFTSIAGTCTGGHHHHLHMSCDHDPLAQPSSAPLLGLWMRFTSAGGTCVVVGEGGGVVRA
jgi:hypothetical protein